MGRRGIYFGGEVESYEPTDFQPKILYNISFLFHNFPSSFIVFRDRIVIHFFVLYKWDLLSAIDGIERTKTGTTGVNTTPNGTATPGIALLLALMT